MAASVKGKLIVWGVPDDVRDAALAGLATTEGIITSFSLARGGASNQVTNEQDDIVTRVDSADEVKVTIEIMATENTDCPQKGDELVLGEVAVGGVDFSTGNLICDDAKADYATASGKKFSVSGTWYPEIAQS